MISYARRAPTATMTASPADTEKICALSWMSVPLGGSSPCIVNRSERGGLKMADFAGSRTSPTCRDCPGACGQIGALDARFLGRDRSLGACRLLFEIGTSGAEIRALRERLGLDSGYLSRLLRSLEREGLVATARSPRDGRVGRVRLTAPGRRELALLNRLSDQSAASLLEPLSMRQRADLVGAMDAVERLLRASAVRVELEDPEHPLAQECLTHYFAELAERFETGFDPSRSISAATEEMRHPRGYFLLATLEGEAVGCGALKCQAGHGEIKRMWVRANSRGLGIGARILDGLETLARRRRLPRVRLETNRALREAQALYRSRGYGEVPAFNSEPYAHHWFEKVL